MSDVQLSAILRSYRERLATGLDEARLAAACAAERAARVSVLEQELAQLDRLIAETSGRRRALPVLDDVSVAAPCEASWDEMVGGEHVRFCRCCEKSVYNLSSLPRDEAEALLAAYEGNVCVRLYRRADGTVLTADCPVGVKKRRRRRATFGALGAGLAAVAVAVDAPMVTSSAPPVAASVMEPTPVRTVDVAPLRAAPPSATPAGHWLGGAVSVPKRPRASRHEPVADPLAP